MVANLPKARAVALVLVSFACGERGFGMVSSTHAVTFPVFCFPWGLNVLTQQDSTDLL